MGVMVVVDSVVVVGVVAAGVVVGGAEKPSIVAALYLISEISKTLRLGN